jgi:hypothetical protein
VKECDRKTIERKKTGPKRAIREGEIHAKMENWRIDFTKTGDHRTI